MSTLHTPQHEMRVMNIWKMLLLIFILCQCHYLNQLKGSISKANEFKTKTENKTLRFKTKTNIKKLSENVQNAILQERFTLKLIIR